MSGHGHGHITWPPRLRRTDVLGEVRDVSNRKIHRDVGNPIYLRANCYYIFGDTFCHDAAGEFHGVSNNTYALVPDPRKEPTRSEYLDGQLKVREYIPFTRSEYEYDSGPEQKQKNDRMTLWSFGGVVENPPDAGTGWVFFTKMITHGAMPGHGYGVGVARATAQPDKKIRMERIMGDEMIFGEGEPSFGSVTNLCDDDGWVYTLGTYDPNPSQLDLRTHIARIRRDADFTQRANYEFFINTLDGKGMWSKTYNSIDDLKRLGDMDVQSQGEMIKVPSFAPEGRPYMWIGNNKFGAGIMYVGCAPRPEGPWEVVEMGDIPNDPAPWDGKSSGPKYSFFPNPRASDLDRGEIICTWTDAAQMGGKVIAARFWFEGDYERGPPPPAQGAHVQQPGSDGKGSAGSHHSGLGDRLKGKIEGFLHK
ncbi:Hypothetical predicted protein [Lecanosticta acicola]|uniref:Uncharacterized protein n=1 Tax=Lecanosticta acicola TaxID=111012 RepID=A0AAI8Z0F2_9PEZI|nr:Hypothetical predicted protein [Lecanosticta acicola]